VDHASIVAKLVIRRSSFVVRRSSSSLVARR